LLILRTECHIIKLNVWHKEVGVRELSPLELHEELTITLGTPQARVMLRLRERRRRVWIRSTTQEGCLQGHVRPKP